jgi:hypothetical protein
MILKWEVTVLEKAVIQLLIFLKVKFIYVIYMIRVHYQEYGVRDCNAVQLRDSEAYHLVVLAFLCHTL